MKQQHTTPGDPPRKGSLLRTLRAVGWSLIGVRQDAEYETDKKALQPLHIVFVGIAALFVFVFILIGLVNWVV